MKCSRDCLHCKFSDCIQEDVTELELAQSELIDIKIIQARAGDTDRRKKDIPEYERMRQQAYYLEHREEKLEYQRRYNEEHAEEIRARQRRYYLLHREEKKAYGKKYRAEHLEEVRRKDRERQRNKVAVVKGGVANV